MRHLLSSRSLKVLLFAAALFAGRAAKSDIVPQLDVVTPSGSNFTYSYNLSVAAGTRVNAGDYFTIYDFNGYVDGSVYHPADWTVSVQTQGMTPFGVEIRAFGGDSPSAVNLTFTYTGPTIVGPVSGLGGPDSFGADSTQSVYGLGAFASSVHSYNPGRLTNNLRMPTGGYVETPVLVKLSSLTVSPTTIAGSLAATGTVTLNAPAPSGGVDVTLTSGNGSVVSVPPSVTVLEGDTTTTFPITTHAVSAPVTVAITGTFNGNKASAQLRVRQIGVAKVSFNPSSVKGGTSSTGTVTLEAPAGPGSIAVTLSSAIPATAKPAVAGITIPAGSSSGTFTVNTFPVAANKSVKITATTPGLSNFANLTVTK